MEVEMDSAMIRQERSRILDPSTGAYSSGSIDQAQDRALAGSYTAQIQHSPVLLGGPALHKDEAGRSYIQ